MPRWPAYGRRDQPGLGILEVAAGNQPDTTATVVDRVELRISEDVSSSGVDDSFLDSRGRRRSRRQEVTA
jgi:hypothetical protein